VLETASVSYGKATTYFPVIELVRSYFGIEPRDDDRKMREKVTGKLVSLDRALEPTLPVFFSLLDVSVEDPEWTRLDPSQRRRQTLDALKRLLLRESQVQPVLLVVEDLHWIDSGTQAWLDLLVESVPTARLLLLVNYRPEYGHGWGSKTYYQQVRLDALPVASAGELLEALLGTGQGLDDLRRLLIDRTQGNPFFLEESVRVLVETRALTGERGAYRLAGPVQSLQLPPTAQAILAARIDRLAPGEKRLLQAAAVVGRDVPFPLLEAIAEEPKEHLREGLARLQAAEFLYEARLFPELEYTFKHALTHEVAYRSLLQEQRKVLHARIMEAIERLYSDRIAEQVERLAHHGLQGEVWGKAAAYLQQAGTKATARSAYREAAVCFESGLATLPHLSESLETLERGIDLRLGLRNALYVLAELEKGFACLREAEPLARRLDDPRRLGWVWVYMSIHLLVSGRAREGNTLAQSAHAVGQTLGDLSLQVAANFFCGFACLALEDYPRAQHFFQQVVQALPDDLERERCGLPGFPAGLARGFLARVLAERGAFAEGIACGEEGLRIGERLDHPWTVIVPCLFLGYLYGLKGDFDPASRLLERAIAVAREKNVMLLAPVASGVLAHAYALSGRVAEALALGQEAVKTMEQIGFRVFYALTVAQLGEACVCAGRLEEAVDHARRALSIAREGGERGHEAWALRLLGEIASHRDPPNVEAAEKHYRESLALAGPRGMRPLVAHCHLGLGKLYRRVAKRDQAREHLATATTMYREMDMRFWLEQAEAEMGGLA
jgi:tetratricopeptide (TPR) repeat protein